MPDPSRRTDFDLVVDGGVRAARSGARFETIDPATGDVVASVARAGAEDVDEAVTAAGRAFEVTWRKQPAAERGRLLMRLSQAVCARAEELAEWESLESGKPLGQARTDVAVAARYFEFYAGAADKVHGDTIPIGPDVFAYTVREPYGVTGHIVPWNYPIQSAARTIAPALAAGNCCVLKPAEQTVTTAVLLGEMALDVGFPPGTVNILPGFGDEAGAALSQHPGVSHLAFTGSPEVGRLVMHAAADHIAPLVLELGGKSPQVVFADADIERTVPFIVKALIQNAGQTCSAGSRLIVDRRVEGAFVEALLEAFKSVVIGRGLDDPDLGPLISEVQLARVLDYIERGKQEGGRLLAGGERLTGDGFEKGCFVPPTLFTGITATDSIAQDEIFGPVLAVIPFSDDAEAIEIANASRFGLVGAVWTQDIDRALAAADELRVGQVFINTYGAGGGVELPFGGQKESGFGREKGVEALHWYTRVKTVAAAVRRPAGAGA